MVQKLSEDEKNELLEVLQERFQEHMERHPNIQWEDVMDKIEDNADALSALQKMEETGGEPDIVGDDLIFIDCSPESPKGRRSICYDREALEGRKKFPPENDAMTMAADMGIEMLTEDEYRHLQTLGEFDLKSSSWVQTPEDIRFLGGAIFCERRYNTVFTFHNSAESYYGARGFRGKLEL